MDCIDCHNRPSHIYRSPEDEVDDAIEAGRIDRQLPFARREAVKALRGTYASEQAARRGILEHLESFYWRLDSQRTEERKRQITAAAGELGDIWARNVWPAMKITWGTYPTLLGHEAAPGCFRCHDGDHSTSDGRAISNACDLCHNIVAQDEKEPAVLKQLSP
jgi:hypothetical protein